MGTQNILTYEDIIEKLKEKGYQLISKEYINSSLKIEFKDDLGYKYQSPYNTIQQNKRPHKFIKSNPFTLENIQNFLDLNSEGSKLISNLYNKNTDIISFTCEKCNKEIHRIWANTITSNNFRCNDCMINPKMHTIEYVKSEFKKNGLTLLDDCYVGNSNKMNCIDEYGYKYFIPFSTIDRKPEKFQLTNKYYMENYENFIRMESNGSSIISMDGNNISFTCEKCGGVCVKNKNSITSRKNFLCTKCNKNKNQEKNGWNKESVYLYYKSKGLDLINIDSFINSKTKMECMDSFGYKYYVNIQGVNKCGKGNRFIKSNKFHIFNIENFLKINSNGSRLISSEYFDKKTFTISCEVCGKEIDKRYDRLVNKNFKCEECNRKKRYLDAGYDINYAKKECGKKGLILLDEKYINNSTKMNFIDKYGYKYFMSLVGVQVADKLLKFDKSNPHTIDNIKLYLKQNSNGSTLVNKKIEKCSRELLTITCEDCGKKITKTWSAVIGGMYFKCHSCGKNESSFESKVRNWLEKNNIEYVQEYKFDDCRVIKALPFDFYLTKLNKLIEVDGEFHEKPVTINNISKNEAIKNLIKRKKYDAIKDKYCKDNNIELLRINYKHIKWKSEIYKELLNNFIKE